MAKYWFGKRAPEHADAWYTYYRAVKTQGVLDTKTKELIAAAVGLVMRCEHCVEAHTKDALRAGASKEEIAEALMVASQIASASQLFFMGDKLEKLLGDA
jgi:AhpD family alkylhydroperoxidase